MNLDFLNNLDGTARHNLILLKCDSNTLYETILEENFIQEQNGQWRVPNMNEAKDREAIRTKALLKEFDRYVTELTNPKAKKLKEVRLEALRAGFRSCFDKKISKPLSPWATKSLRIYYLRMNNC